MRHGSGIRRGLAAAARGLVPAAFGLMAMGCGSSLPTSTVESPGAAGAIGRPVSATNQADGVLVTLAISSDRVIAGERISIRISALNAGLGPVAYEAGGCGPIMGIVVTGPPIPSRTDVMPEGTGAAAILGLAKWSALSQGGTQLDWIRTPGMPNDVAMACTADLRYDEIAPGGTFTDDAVWIARIADGAPAPAGDYAVRLDFPFAGRRAKEDVPVDVRAESPIAVSVPLLVEPGPKVVVDAEAAIDAAIADPDVMAWARSLTRERLTGSTITMIDGRWRWRIEHVGGQADVYVDPVTGAVLEKRLGG